MRRAFGENFSESKKEGDVKGWRPDDWPEIKERLLPESCYASAEERGIEAGADAILEALKASGRCVRAYGSKATPRLHIPGLHGVVTMPGGNPAGWIIFIEEPK